MEATMFVALVNEIGCLTLSAICLIQGFFQRYLAILIDRIESMDCC